MQLIKLKLPHTLALIFSIMVFVAILTWIIPGGQYDRVINRQGREVVDGESFHCVDSEPQGLFALLQSPIKGIIETANIIGFILILGGVFSIIQNTGAINASIRRVGELLEGREKIVIPVGMTLFSIFGAVFGMSEEVIPFVLIFIPLAMTLGYDSIIGVAIPFLGAGVGFAGALLNPFTIGIAQGIAELPLFSGLIYRLMVWFIVTLIGILAVMRYAKKVKHDPETSPVYELDQKRRQRDETESDEHSGFSRRHKIIMMIFLIGIAVMIFGVMRFQWFIEEIAALFLGMGIAVGIVSRLSTNSVAESFVDGARDLIGAALVVGFARAILVIASDGMIIDTIMHYLSGLISQFHPIFAAQMMFGMQTFINFLVPSGSGQAALTMPIMSPLADLVGVTRQTAVLAFQMGDGFTNMIIPTSGVTMGVLGMAKIPWQTWANWLLPLEIVFFIIGLILLVPAVLMQWGPF
ncbi:putative basic amino acid antiporter YfcC [candidate division KSB1 bacterium]|nr:putative basic amino acid antiporter YfcC [candidate division KSB1 bacterium]